MNEINAYRLKKDAEISKGQPARDWMDLTNERFAYGCLPLIIANEMGWDLPCPASFRAIWNGGVGKDAILVEYGDPNDESNKQVLSHFGEGVITFEPGFLFQTNEGVNLYVKGTPNYIKDGIQALEGLVETDWLPLTFTMNWKFTRTNTWVEFVKGEPIARLLPYPRNFIESFKPAFKTLQTNESLANDFKVWGDDRMKVLEDISQGNHVGMEKNYFQGIDKNQRKVERHQRKIVLQDFKSEKKPD